MATYFLRFKVISRGKGGRITRSAAYRAGERIRDERSGEVYNHSGRTDVPYKEVVLPSKFADRPDMDWARDRATLWNAVEHAGRRRNAVFGREVLVLLPDGLGAGERAGLARRFAQELADRYGSAVDLAVHEPRAGADERHHHAHLLMTHREVTPEGLGARTTLGLSGSERHARGLCPAREEILDIRERWAQVANTALQEAGIDARIDHRSYKDQGIEREPKPHIPEKVYYAEKRTGEKTRAGEELRAKYRERVEARRQGADALERVVQRQRNKSREQVLRYLADTGKSRRKLRWSMRTREEINQWNRERRAASAQKAQKIVDPKEKAARRWLEYFEKHGAAGGLPKTEQVAHHPRHGFRWGRADEKGGRDGSDERNESAASEPEREE